MTPETEITPEKLRPCLERAAALCGYTFDDWDWDTIRFALEETDRQQGHWFTYPFEGTQYRLVLELAQSSSSRDSSDAPAAISVRARPEEPTNTGASALCLVLTRCAFGGDETALEELIAQQFGNISFPDGEDQLLSCSAEHLSRCPECQEALAFFGGRTWKQLVQEEQYLPVGFADLSLLTQQARLYFLPAYLIAALQQSDLSLFEDTSEKVEWTRSPQAPTPVQEELVRLLSGLLKEKERQRAA
jgi:hypothetical protein